MPADECDELFAGLRANVKVQACHGATAPSTSPKCSRSAKGGVCWVEISYRNRVGLNIGAVR